MHTHTSELRSRLEASLEHRIPRALTPIQRPAPELMPIGIAEADALTGGIPLGCLTEICGPESSGRTSILLAALAACMRRDEICAIVDASDAFDPHSAANAGVDLARLLWVRCQNSVSPRRHRDTEKSRRSGGRVIGSSDEIKPDHQPRDSRLLTSPDHPITRSPDSKELSQLDQALKATDLLLQAGGFGLIVLDIADVPISAARKIPLTTWFRFRRAVENTSTALVIVEQYPHAKSCASLVMDFAVKEANWSETADPETSSISSSGTSSLDAVQFRVTSEGIAIPFEKSAASSFEMPQRWNMPHARLLNTVHVHLQITRSRMNGAKKFPVCSERVIPSADVARGIPTSTQHLQVQ